MVVAPKAAAPRRDRIAIIRTVFMVRSLLRTSKREIVPRPGSDGCIGDGPDAVAGGDVVVVRVQPGAVANDEVAGEIHVDAPVIVGDVVSIDAVAAGEGMDSGAIAAVAVVGCGAMDDLAVREHLNAVPDVERGHAIVEQTCGICIDAAVAVVECRAMAENGAVIRVETFTAVVAGEQSPRVQPSPAEMPFESLAKAVQLTRAPPAPTRMPLLLVAAWIPLMRLAFPRA